MHLADHLDYSDVADALDAAGVGLIGRGSERRREKAAFVENAPFDQQLFTNHVLEANFMHDLQSRLKRAHVHRKLVKAAVIMFAYMRRFVM